jgi:hypothetical protein
VSRFGRISKDRAATSRLAKWSPVGSKFMASFGNHVASPTTLGAA